MEQDMQKHPGIKITGEFRNGRDALEFLKKAGADSGNDPGLS